MYVLILVLDQNKNFKYLLLPLLYLLELYEIPPLIPFSKNMCMPASGISSSSFFVILRFASQIKPDVLK